MNKKTRLPYLKSQNLKSKPFGVQCNIKNGTPNISETDIFLNDDIKKHYLKSILTINKVHTHMNHVLNQKNMQGGEDNEFLFKMPEVQNYLPLYTFLLDTDIGSTVKVEKNENEKCFRNVVEKLSNTSIIEFVPEIKKLKEYKELEKKLSTHSKDIQTDFVECFTEKSVFNKDDSESVEAEDSSQLTLNVNQEDLENFISIPEKLKELNEVNLENRNVMAELIKEQVREQFEELILNTKKEFKIDAEKTLSKIVISQENILGKTNTQISCMKQTLPKISKNTINTDLDIMDDNESIILDDEEFEKLKEKSLKEQQKVYRRVEPVIKKPIVNCPLKLNQRDMPTASKEILSAIGIFNEKGEIRPDVIDMMEKRKEKNGSNTRNKKFREERQNRIDFYKSSASSDSSDIKSDFENEDDEIYEKFKNDKIFVGF